MDQQPKSQIIKPLNSIPNSITILLVISLPIFYITLLHIPPSNLLKDTTFWFLLSNTIIIIVATDSGAFSSGQNRETNCEIYDKFILHNKTRKKEEKLGYSPEEEKIEVVKNKEVIFLEEKEDKSGDFLASDPIEANEEQQQEDKEEEECDYWSMSDEELNKKVEEFIRFNREIMFQEERM